MGDTSADKRYDFICEYVLQTLKLKNDKWQKCIGIEDNKVLMQEFFDKSDIPVLVISSSSAGALTPTYEFPTSAKTKAVYFIKKSKENITPDGIKGQLFYGDISYAPLDQLSSLVDEVSIALISTLEFGGIEFRHYVEQRIGLRVRPFSECVA